MSTAYTGDGITFADGTNIASGNTGFKNRIINGDMRIDQRNAGASVTPTDLGYTLDRWQVSISQASKVTIQQNAGSVTPPAGFTKYLGVTSTSSYSLAAGDYFLVNQKIEGYNIADLGFGTANAKTVTLSFWAWSSLTGTFGGALTNGAGNRSCPFSYSIPVANTWTQISITVAGDTTGTWSTTNGTGLQLTFGIGVGSTYSGTAGSWSSNLYMSATGATSIVGTSGATFYITGVQLEAGTQATTFDYRSYGTELALCQRYYWKNKAGTNYTYLASGVNNSATTGSLYQKTPVTMRANPTIVVGNIAAYSGGGITGITSLGTNYSSPDMIAQDFSCATTSPTSGAVAIISNNNSAAYIDASSEL